MEIHQTAKSCQVEQDGAGSAAAAKSSNVSLGECRTRSHAQVSFCSTSFWKAVYAQVPLAS